MDAQGPRKGKKVQGRKALSFEILWKGLETIRNNLEKQKESSSHYTLKSYMGQRETSPSTRQVLSELKQNLTFVHSWFWGPSCLFLGICQRPSRVAPTVPRKLAALLVWKTIQVGQSHRNLYEGFFGSLKSGCPHRTRFLKTEI